MTFLLEVYGQLEEPDGLSGLVQLRQGGLTTGDQILVAEKAGSWGEALALYEHELGKDAARWVAWVWEGRRAEVGVRLRMGRGAGGLWA